MVKDFQGKLLNGPNDLWIRPDGGIYFSDPLYKRPYWNRGPSEQDRQCVYFLAPDRQQLTRVASDLTQPNGLIGTPDGKTLYVADIGAKRTYAYDVQADGALANKRLFCELGSDGMTIDNEGNVYLTGKGVIVFDKTGQQIEHFDVPEGWTANVCFGGADKHTLFITASKGLVRDPPARAGRRQPVNPRPGRCQCAISRMTQPLPRLCQPCASSGTPGRIRTADTAVARTRATTPWRILAKPLPRPGRPPTNTSVSCWLRASITTHLAVLG